MKLTTQLIVVLGALLSSSLAQIFSLPIVKHQDSDQVEPRLLPPCREGAQDQQPLTDTSGNIVRHAPVGDINEYLAVYTVNISLGTPPQTFRALIDLSWSDTFVHSSNCFGAECKAFQRLYNSSASSTYKPNGKPATIIYYPISGFGRVSSDDFTLGTVRMPRFDFIEMNTYIDTYLPPDSEIHLYDGVLGLGMDYELRPWDPTPRQSKIPSLLKQMIARGLLERNMFSVLWPTDTKNAGDIMFGGLNESLFTGDLVSHPLLLGEKKQWGIRVESVYLDTKDGIEEFASSSKSSAESSAGGNWTALLSSRTPLISVPARIAQSLHQKIGWTINECTGSMVVDCDHIPQFPNLIIGLENQNVTLRGSDYTVRRKVVERGCKDMADECMVMVSHSPMDEDDPDSMLLGMGFLKTVYTVFDSDEKSVSFGQLITMND